jgi:predicted polyphosphate/ATP-dependent NAD kinase
MIAKDVNERQLAQLLNGRKAKIVVTVIGGQGYILGRGNQQLSPEIIKRVGKDNIIVVATKEKLASLGGRLLLVDTGSKDADRMLGGYVRVITGFNDYVMYKVGT